MENIGKPNFEKMVVWANLSNRFGSYTRTKQENQKLDTFEWFFEHLVQMNFADAVTMTLSLTITDHTVATYMDL